jgi:hypothetical protein
MIVFVFCFLLIIDGLCVLFPCDYWLSLCSVSFWSLNRRCLPIRQRLSMIRRKQNTDYQWSKGNIAHRLSMIKRKENTKTINDQKETEHKDYQWSKGNITQRLSIVFVISFLLIIDSLCVMFPFDNW